jgi:cephalosporin hydroxylase
MGDEDGRAITIDVEPVEKKEMLNKCRPGRTCPCSRPPTTKLRPAGSLGRDKLWKQHVRQIVALSSTSPEAVSTVKRELRWLPLEAPVLFTLDSGYAEDHVWAEIELYAPLVRVGSYLVIQDVILDYVKYPWRGPKGAADRLLNAPEDLRRKLGTFMWDKSVEVFGYTGHMYLRRVL